MAVKIDKGKCTGCGTKVSHQSGIPCYEANCSKCGSRMGRE